MALKVNDCSVTLDLCEGFRQQLIKKQTTLADLDFMFIAAALESLPEVDKDLLTQKILKELGKPEIGSKKYDGQTQRIILHIGNEEVHLNIIMGNEGATNLSHKYRYLNPLKICPVKPE